MSGLDISDVPEVRTRQCAHCGRCSPKPAGWVGCCCWNPIGCECATSRLGERVPVRKLGADLRPQVTVEPCMRFGAPNIHGISVEALADKVWVGESVAEVAEEYSLTVAEVVVACWFMARHGVNGNRAYLKRWAGWLAEVEDALWHSRFDVPDPPSREEAK